MLSLFKRFQAGRVADLPSISAVAFHPTQPHVAVCFATRVAVHNVHTGGLISQLTVPDAAALGNARFVFYSPDGECLVVTSGNGSILTWSVPELALIFTHFATTKVHYSLSLSLSVCVCVCVFALN
jgi:WD40 repeat protein